jgi:hypothetical protein
MFHCCSSRHWQLKDWATGCVLLATPMSQSTIKMEKCCQGTHTCFNCNIWRCPLTAVCGYSSVSCNTHDMPRHQRPTHTVQMLHTIIPPHCITAGRENVQNDANHIKLIVIGVRNITTIESTMALNLLFVIVVRLRS